LRQYERSIGSSGLPIRKEEPPHDALKRHVPSWIVELSQEWLGDASNRRILRIPPTADAIIGISCGLAEFLPDDLTIAIANQ